MKNRNRRLSFLLSLCLVIGLVSTAASASGVFRDVGPKDWFHQAVTYVFDHQMMSGTGSDTFSPNGTTTRGMIVTVLHRMEGTPAAAAAGFTDVESGKYYADAVAWAAENEIVSGYGGGAFGPDDPITREQMAAILYRYAAYKGYDVTASGSLSIFSDADAVHSYSETPMRWAIGCGLISGMGNGTLAPQGSATRAQIAVILMRFNETIVLGNPMPEKEVPEEQDEETPEEQKPEETDPNQETEENPEETPEEKPIRPEPVLTGPTFVLDKVDAKAGQTDVQVTVSVKKNPGIIALALLTSYDQDLVLTSIEYHEEAGGQTMLPQTIQNPTKLLWMSPLEEVKNDFVLCTLHFDVSKDAKPGHHPISIIYDPDDVYNMAEENMEFAVLDGAIIVEK